MDFYANDRSGDSATHDQASDHVMEKEQHPSILTSILQTPNLTSDETHIFRN